MGKKQFFVHIQINLKIPIRAKCEEKACEMAERMTAEYMKNFGSDHRIEAVGYDELVEDE